MPKLGSPTPIRLTLAFDGTRLCYQVFWVLVLIQLFLVSADLLLYHFALVPYHHIRYLFDVTREVSFGNYFSSLQFLFLALVLFALATRSPKPAKTWWGVFAGLFIFLSIDDAVGLHERMGTVAVALIEGASRRFEFFPSYPWMVVLGPIFLVAGVALVYWGQKFMTRENFANLLLGLALFGLAVGIDFVEGLEGNPVNQFAVAWNFSDRDVQHLVRLVEESLEMLGCTFLIAACLGTLTAALANPVSNRAQVPSNQKALT